MPICIKCALEKGQDDFVKNKTSRTGYSSVCKTCRSEQQKKYNASDKYKKYLKDYYLQNKDKYKERSDKLYSEHRDVVLARNKQWYYENKDQVFANCAKRRVRKIQARPDWLSNTDQLRIKELYSQARKMSAATGVPHHVDHIIPLQGELVCGLHIPENLQILSGSENSRKKNKWLSH